MCLAVGQPFNIAVMLKIQGSVEIKPLESTFKKLQKRHPLLQVRIFQDENDRPWFTSKGVGTIPVTEIKRTDDSQASLEFHRQLSKPFDFESEKLPLIRIFVISSPEITEIIICTRYQKDKMRYAIKVLLPDNAYTFKHSSSHN